MGIPSTLVVAPLGAVGGPATVFAALVLIFYLVTWLHPALAPAHGRQPFRAAGILFAAAVITTYVSANRHSMPSLEANGADRGIILVCGWLGILVMASDGIASMERLQKLLGRVVIGATAMAILGITQFFTGLDATKYIVIPGLTAQSAASDLLSRNGLNRPAATAAHPLEFAAVLAMALPLAIHRARFAPPGKRLTRWLQAALIGAALPMTVSRTAILAVVVICLVILPTWPKRTGGSPTGAGRGRDLHVGQSRAAGHVPQPVRRAQLRLQYHVPDLSVLSAGPYISQHPWFGRGFGTFLPATYFFTDDQYLLGTIEFGIVGVLCLLTLFITGLVTARKVRRITADPVYRDLGQAMTASVAVAMVTFATFDALSFAIASGLVFMLLGCTGAALRILRSEAAPASRRNRSGRPRLTAGRLRSLAHPRPQCTGHRPGPAGWPRCQPAPRP